MVHGLEFRVQGFALGVLVCPCITIESDVSDHFPFISNSCSRFLSI